MEKLVGKRPARLLVASWSSAPSTTSKGSDKIKLIKSDDKSGGQHHFIPLTWVDRVDAKIHLKKS